MKPRFQRLVTPAIRIPLGMLIFFLAATLHAADRKPNVVLILIDDFGYECVTANGGESYKTPVMEQLAATGDLEQSPLAASALDETAKAAKAELAALLKSHEGPREEYFVKQSSKFGGEIGEDADANKITPLQITLTHS